MAHFAIEHLTFFYPGADAPALSDVSLEIEQGSYVVVCGKSGCGKTTLLRHLKSALSPHGNRTGRVLFEGAPLEEACERDQAAKIGFVMQNPDAQIVTDKVWHELAFGLESLGCDTDSLRFRTAEMASYFGIESWFHKDVSELSGGQKQLLNLASIMAMQPSALVLDEPTSQLDPIAASEFLATIRKINLELGVTIVLTEHRLEEVFAVADRVVVMDAGKLVSVGGPRAVAAELHATGNDMAAALPTPARIFYGVAKNVPSACENAAAPLSVREGRAWLSSLSLPEARPCAQAGASDAGPVAEPPSHPVLSFKEVWFRYDRDGADVVRGATFEVARGSLFAIMGGNGAGKSTLLRAACGIAKPYRGTVRVFGRKLKDWKGDSLFKGCLALLPQDPQNLFVKKTVREDLEEMLSGEGLSAEERETRIARVVATADIAHLLGAHPFDLSGGELERAALAKVLLAEPKILLLDEPTKGIDGFFKRKLAAIFDELKRQGTTIVMVSHDVEFCARYADAVSMMFDGEIIAVSAPRTFFSRTSFYTTAANRMSRHIFPDAITCEEVVARCSGN